MAQAQSDDARARRVGWHVAMALLKLSHDGSLQGQDSSIWRPGVNLDGKTLKVN